ncbi:MAG: EAL domain-containing protein [Rhodocyclaceae bacterium]|nr:EAL domain-containing protein [Rhodocyclaceae bacterium]
MRHNIAVNSAISPVPPAAALSGSDVPVDFAALVRDSGNAIVTLDPAGRVTSWNPAAMQLLGYAAGEVAGCVAPHLPGPGDLPEPGRRVARRRHSEGHLVDVLATVSPILGADGTLAGWSEILVPLAADGAPLASGKPDIDLALRGALHNGEFELLYQPIFRLADRRPIGAEALLRWHRRDNGILLPDRFVHIAERDGLIADIGLFVMRSACAQIGRWLGQGAQALPLSVNVSAHQFRLPDFAPSFAAAIRESDVDPHWLKLEVTESALIEDPASASAKLAELRALGVGIAIDDFGVGYSSLSRLRQYPIDTLKIDHSFVRDIASDAIAREVAGAIIRLAHKLGMTVVAEGIETEAQFAVLQELGCDAGQGFLLGRPTLADEIIRLI